MKPPVSPLRPPPEILASLSRLFRPLLLAFWVSATASTPPTETHYLNEIKPLLQERCYSCHGALNQKGRLRLDTAAFMLQGGKSGPAFQPGNLSNSPLLERLATSDLDQRMPPEHEGQPLSQQQIDRIRAWISAGAPAPANESPAADPKQHWAFRPRLRPPIPASPIPNPAWPKNPIDTFIARQHAARGLTPQPEAPKAILLRRLFFDLIGLPPAAHEIEAVENDNSPRWYENAVDRLLSDPRHGERWARHWMDIWRYSDWWGLGDQLRNSQKHIHHWRDWIIESLNNDLPYDEMIRLMLAADESHPADLPKLRATGYLARNYFLFNRNQWLEETVEHVSKGFLGLTMNCAKCHDHKFDPIVQDDFYRFRAFFEPYHVRLDVLPEEPNLAINGLPRVYDGHLNAPTYRFVRGQENQPDKTASLPPGIPALFNFKKLLVQPIDLPPEAWQPERRPWVFAAHRQAAQAKLASTQPPQDSAPGLERTAAQLAFSIAQKEAESLERRIEALQARWAREDSPSLPALLQTEQSAQRLAVQAERELALVKAQHAVAALNLRLEQAPPDKKESLEKELKAARESLDKADQLSKTPPAPNDPFTPIPGAVWTATRFFDSTKDDPKVEFPPQSSGRRTALAHWITDPRNPLTARVAVNHLWLRHFGAPLVQTVFDFGLKGSPPTHPELLDWLASELVENSWSLKHLHRLLVTSAAYRMTSSAAGAETSAAKDPDNLQWWRRNPIRLEAQAVRDSILALTGTLDLTQGGPSIPPAQQTDSRRRSLYFFHSNNDRNLFLASFDEASVKECYRRDQSIVPQQALALSNSRLVQDAAPLIAARLASTAPQPLSSPNPDAPFIRAAFRLLLGFEPNPAEIEASTEAMRSWRTQPTPQTQTQSQHPDPAQTHLVWALLNHNDFVTLR